MISVIEGARETIFNEDSELAAVMKTNKKQKEKPGTIVETKNNILVSTGNGYLEITLLQIYDEPLCNSQVFEKSYQIKVGELFENS